METRCSLCSAVVGKGKTHKCTKVNMQDNLHQLVKQTSLKSKEKIGGQIIKNIFNEKGASQTGVTVMLCTAGKKLPVSLRIKVNKVRFTHENLKRLQMIHSSSDRGIRTTAQAIRYVMGRNSVEPRISESLTERNKSLKEFF